MIIYYVVCIMRRIGYRIRRVIGYYRTTYLCRSEKYAAKDKKAVRSNPETCRQTFAHKSSAMHILASATKFVITVGRYIARGIGI